MLDTCHDSLERRSAHDKAKKPISGLRMTNIATRTFRERTAGKPGSPLSHRTNSSFIENSAMLRGLPVFLTWTWPIATWLTIPQWRNEVWHVRILVSLRS